MSGSNKVNVTIFKHEYKVSGSKPRDYIVKIADYVDSVMKDMSNHTDGMSLSSLAVLSAVNIADNLFEAMEGLDAKEAEKEHLQKDIGHYIQLWEEAKRNFLQNKEDSQGFVDEIAGVQEKLNEKAIENDRLLKIAAEKDRRIEELTDEKSKAIVDITDMKDRRIDEITAEMNARIEELTKERDEGIASATAKLDARVEELAKEKEEGIASVSAKLNARIEELAKEKEEGIAAATAKLEARVEELTKEKEEGIASVTAKLNARIEELTKEVDQNIASATAEKDARLDELMSERNQRIVSITEEKDSRIELLEGQLRELSEQLIQKSEKRKFPADDVRDLNDKYKELEGNYFEIQMENIKLKGEIERLNSIAPGTSGS